MVSTTANIMANTMGSTMEIKKHWIVLSAVLAVVLIGAVIYTTMNTDREGPIISVPTDDILYKEGEDTVPLLTGVTAMDEQEGDVSATLIVESVIPLSDETQAKVIYAAKDSHNNISKADRIIQYEPLPEPVVVTDPTDMAAREAAVRVAYLIAEKAKQAATVSENIVDQTEETTEEQATNEEGFNGIVAGAAAVTEGNRQEEELEDEPEPEPAAVPENEPASVPEPTTAPTASPDAPKVTLTTKAISMYQGDAFNPYAFIASAIDSGADVTHLVNTSGSVDTSKVGNYTVTYFATDADGHKSNTETLKVQVIPRP